MLSNQMDILKRLHDVLNVDLVGYSEIWILLLFKYVCKQ